MENIKKNTKIILQAFIFFIASIALFNCGGGNQQQTPNTSSSTAKSEDTVYVKIQTLELKSIVKTLNFFAKLSGIQESTKYSMVADRIKRVRVKIGDYVKEGQVVIDFPSDNPALQLSQAEEALKNSEKIYNRMKELAKSGQTALQNLDNTETQYLVSKRNYESLKQMIHVEAPISGIVISLPVKEGDDVKVNAALFTVGQINKMKVKIWASETEINYIKIGMIANIKFGDKIYTGKVSQVDLKMDEKTHAFGIEVVIPNPRGELKSGVTVDVAINVAKKNNVIVIPRNIIQIEGNKKFVFIEENGRAAKKYIETGLESEIEVEVTSGLKVSDKLIVEGYSFAKDGSPVVIK